MTREVDNSDMIGPDVPDSADESAVPGGAIDAWLADDTVVAARDEDPIPPDADSAEDDVESEPESEVGPEDAPDAVSSWLLRVALALIVVVLATATAMVIFFVSAEKAPRTVVERDVASAEIAARARPSDPVAWQALAYAYISSKRYDDAIAVSRRGFSSTGAKVLVLSEADALRAAGRHKEAIALYDDAVISLSREESAAVAAQKKKGITMPISDDGLVTAYYGRALSRRQMGDTAGAISDMKRALEFAPQQSSLLATLGELYEKSGDAAKAEAAYREALRFIPDYPAALSGLKRLEKRP